MAWKFVVFLAFPAIFPLMAPADGERTLAIKVIDIDGRVAQDVRVLMYDPEGKPLRQYDRTADKNGECSIKDIQPGKYLARVWNPEPPDLRETKGIPQPEKIVLKLDTHAMKDGNYYETEIEVLASDRETSTIITLEKSAVIEGTIKSTEGRLFQSKTAVSVRETGGWGAITMNKDRSFRLYGLSAKRGKVDIAVYVGYLAFGERAKVVEITKYIRDIPVTGGGVSKKDIFFSEYDLEKISVYGLVQFEGITLNNENREKIAAIGVPGIHAPTILLNNKKDDIEYSTLPLNGEFKFWGLPPGTYTLTIRYDETKKEVPLEIDGQSVRQRDINITLRPGVNIEVTPR